jgi:IclR family pca regulon transcriptional regulator
MRENTGLSTLRVASAIAQRDLVEGLSKGLRVIEAFDDEHPTLTATECARRCEITRTAARRHLLTLVHLAYAGTDGKVFWLAPRVMRLGESYLEAARLPRLVQPFIQQLSAATGETVNFSVLDGHEVLYLSRSNSPRVVSLGFQRGARAPAHVVAPGVVLLSALSDAELELWVNEHSFTSFTARTVSDPQQFVKQVQLARSVGWWTLANQLDASFSGLATLVTNRRGRVQGAIGMTFPSALWDQTSVERRLAPALLSTAASLRAVL